MVTLGRSVIVRPDHPTGQSVGVHPASADVELASMVWVCEVASGSRRLTTRGIRRLLSGPGEIMQGLEVSSGSFPRSSRWLVP